MAGGGVLAGVDLNVLSLLPRTLGPRYDAAVPSGKWSEEKELDAIRCFFKSMISRDQGKLTGEDEDKVTDPLNAFDDDGNETETVNHMDRRQGRRPGLGRKRARFSFNPNLSDPLLRLDTKSRLNHIKDPEEYFAAVAKMELAEKVLKKLRGEADTECTQESQWTAPRKHRPGLPWNRVRKRHQFIPPFESAEATSLPRCEDLPLSPMKSTKDSSFNPSFPATNQSGKLQQGKTANTDLYTASDFQGSTVEGEKSVDHVLSDLLYCFEDVNEGEEIEFLEKKLRIKSISVDKICLPPLDRCSGNNLAIMDGKRTGESLDSSKNVSEKKSHSPLALLASLKRRIIQKDHQEDPFSMESLSDSSSEDFSLNEGSCRPSKTRSRLHSRGKSHASSFESEAGMRIPISMALEDGGVDSRCMGQHPCMPIVANDVALASIKPNSRDKVDDILMEASVAEELITDVVDISERTVGDGVSCGTSSDNKVHDVYEAPASIGVKDIFSSSLNNDAERTLHTSGITSQGDVIPHPLRASSEEKANDALADESVHEDKIANDNTTLDNAIERDSSDVNCMDNYEVSVPQQEPKSFGAGTEVIVGAESTESVREDQPTSNTVVDFGFEEESDDMHQEAQITGEEDSDDEELPLGFANSELKRTSDFDDASKNKANEVEEAHARSNEDQSNAEADSGDKELELDFMNSAPERASSSFDASTNKANDVQEAHAPSKEDRSNADVDANIPVGRCSEISGIIDEHNVEVSDPREGPVSFDAGTEVIANAESSESVREEQPKSTSVIDFGFEKESDDIHQEALIASEGHSDDEILPSGFENSDPAGASSFDTSMNKDNEVDEVHAPSNEDQSNADADCGEKELDLGVVNSELERASSAFDASMNEANDLQDAHAPSNEDQSSADVDANIPVGGCSGNSGILIEHNFEGENQPSSTALLNPKEAPRKRRGNQRKTDRRQSLAAAGTAWQCGVRRSTRIRTKPLAHWRGERLLYARIHDTLPTVIGMKYASPGKNTLERPPVLKVKSFVSEEYADLLQKVSLH